MLKWERIWPLVFVLVVFAGGALISIPHMPDQAAYSAAYQGNPQQELEWQSPVTWATLIIAVFAVFQYFEFRRSSERQLRAYVDIAEGAVNPREATLTMKNFGQTPARKVCFWLAAELRFGDDVPSFDKPDDIEWSGETGLAPTAKFRMKHNVIDRREREATVDDKSAYYVYGLIKYEDAFMTERTVQFRYYLPETMGPNALIMFDNGNRAD